MNIIIKIKNLKLTEALSDFIKKRIGGIGKFLKRFGNDPSNNQKDSVDAFIEVSKETNHHRKGDLFRAEAKLNLPGKSLMAKAHGEDLGKAVTEVRDELKREIGKYKTRTVEFPRRKFRRVKREVF